MHLIDAKCNNRIITSLFHFASTLATQNEIKNQNVIIITLFQNVLQHLFALNFAAMTTMQILGHTNVYLSIKYCKFGNFRESCTFAKASICEFSRK